MFIKKNFNNNRKYYSTIIIIIFTFILVTACKEEKNQETTIETNQVLDINSIDKKKTKLINLSATQIKELNIPVLKISSSISDHILSVPGFVFPAPENISIVSAPLDGRVVKIYAHEGEKINKGQILLELESLEYGNLVADFLKSKADETYQKQKLNRIKELVSKKISSKGTLDKAQAEYTRSVAESRAAYAKLKAVGTSEKDIKNLTQSTTINPRLKIVAAISGIIDKHLIDLGQSVIAYDKMLSIIDLKNILVKGYVSPEDGTLLQVSNKIKVSQKNNSAKFIEGNISAINPALDETNKSIVVNAILPTIGQWPKPGENLKVEIFVKSSKPEISIPLSAVTYNGNNSVVFVKITESQFEQRKINISKIYNDSAIVTNGLKQNEEIAIDNIFSLKALGRFEDYAE